MTEVGKKGDRLEGKVAIVTGQTIVVDGGETML